MDIERVVASKLKELTGLACYLEKPAKDVPDEYLVITQTGGAGQWIEDIQLDVDCYAPPKQRKLARANASLVEAAATELDSVENIFGPVATNTYRQNDPDTGEARYVVQIELTICE